MKLRTKLFLSFLFLFSIIVLLSGIGSWFIKNLSDDARAIMKDNYRTLEYMQGIDAGLDEMLAYLPFTQKDRAAANNIQKALIKCEGLLQQQMENITEAGEKQLTESLQDEIDLLKTQINQISNQAEKESSTLLEAIIPQIARIRELSGNIYSINEESILENYHRATKTADHAILYMTIFGVSGIVIALVFILSIPGYITQPLSRLNEGIKQIASKHYEYQLPVKGNDELGEIATSFNQMAQRLFEYDQSSYALVLSEKKRIDAIINQMHEAIIGIDEHQTVLFANSLALELTNLHNVKVKGQAVGTLAKTNALFARITKTVDEKGAPEPMLNTVKIVHQGKEKAFAKEILPVVMETSEKGTSQPLGMVIVLTDITAFAEKDRAKTHFIATISHELKTPISSITLGVKLLKDGRAGALNPEQLELLNSIKDDSERLLKITSELLKMAQVETGNIQLEIQPTDPLEIVNAAMQVIVKQAEANEVQILKEIDLMPGAMVASDPEKTAWVLINLLSNAVRFAPKGSAIVMGINHPGKGSIRFSVEDAGPGIAPEFQERIFEKYFQAPDTDRTGTGLGLAISKEFIHAMNGSLQLQSTPGKGSLFYFDLPQATR